MIYTNSFTQEEKRMALDNIWSIENGENIEVGNLAEILVYKWKGLTWQPKNRRDTGCDIFFDNSQWQIKSVKDEANKKWIFLDKRDLGFENYILVIISQDKAYGQILLLGDKKFLDCNSQDTPFGKAINYK